MLGARAPALRAPAHRIEAEVPALSVRFGPDYRWCHTIAVVMWRVRDFHADDLDAAVRLWEDPAASSEAPPFGLSDLIAAVRSHQPAVAAVVGEELAGVAVATVTGDQAWVMRISLAAAWRRRGRNDTAC